MIVLRNGLKVYCPKLTIRSCLVIQQIFGDVTKPLFSLMSVETQTLLLSLALQQYDITEDELYDLMDTVEDVNNLILELYSEAGLIAHEEQQNHTESVSETMSDTSGVSVTFESHVSDLLQQCMSIGMREEEFYNSTLSQVTRYVESYNKLKDNQMQEKAYFDYQLANLIGMSVARLLSKGAKYPTFEKAYPFVNKDNDKETDESWEMEKQHLKLLEWAEQMNKKFEVKQKESH